MSEANYFENKNHFRKYGNIESALLKKGNAANGLFSIVIPTYKRADLLGQAVGSCLDQTYEKPFEIIIVDNDPTPGNDTEKLILSIDDNRITYYKNGENIGCLGNFNRCIELCRSEYLIMLHTDDLLHDNYLETVVPFLSRNPSADMLVPGKRIIRNGRIQRQYGYFRLSAITFTACRGVLLDEKDFSFYNVTGGPIGIVMRRSMCIELGGFDESVFPVSDYAFWVRAASGYKVINLPLVLGDYRFIESISTESGMQFSYIESEYRLIRSLISGKTYKRRFYCYLLEYIYFRLKKSGLGRVEFKSITGIEYRFRPIRKAVFILVIAEMSLFYLKRALFSKYRF